MGVRTIMKPWYPILLAAMIVPNAAPASPIKYAETQVQASGPTGPLAGTLLAPETPSAPLVLIIPGSGPTDRDGNSPLGIRAGSYRLLAEGLAARGVASVRIDKRGMFGSAAAVPDANAVSIADYVSDIQAWATSIEKRIGANCIWLLGHSEGGLVAMAAARSVPHLCGLILVSTAGRPMGEVLREQLRANPANEPLLAQAFAAIDALEAGRRVDGASLHPALQPLFAPQVQGFLISAFALDPAKLLAGTKLPVLMLQGQRDMQVSANDARLLLAAAPGATLTLLPGVNHVLKSVASDDPAANIATYADPALPLAPGVLDSISEFLQKHGQPAPRKSDHP